MPPKGTWDTRELGLREEEANLGHAIAPVITQDPKTSGDQPESAWRSFHLALSNLIATFHLGTKEDITQTWLLKLTKSISKNRLDKMPSSFLYKKEESDLIIHFQQ